MQSPNFSVSRGSVHEALTEVLKPLKQKVKDSDKTLKALVWFWIINETQSTNLYTKCV